MRHLVFWPFWCWIHIFSLSLPEIDKPIIPELNKPVLIAKYMKRSFLFSFLVCAALSVSAQNPYLPLWEHVPDGEPRVFEDPDQPGKFRAYIIGSHDTNYTAYCGSDIRMWSAPVEDLTQWRDEGPIFTWYVDGQWDTMFAPHGRRSSVCAWLAHRLRSLRFHREYHG